MCEPNGSCRSRLAEFAGRAHNLCLTFSKNGVITTLHRLKTESIDRLESDLERRVRNRPIELVLPPLYSEFETAAMQRIAIELIGRGGSASARLDSSYYAAAGVASRARVSR